MFTNTNISNKYFIRQQAFRQNTPEALPIQSTTNSIESKEINLNNTSSVQNKIIVQQKQLDYKELQIFNIPNIGEGKVYELKNGHKVIILPKAGNTVIHTEVNAGRAYEPKGKGGISHLLEHVLFENHDFEKVGGILGGQTGEIHTNFWGEFPVETPQELEKMIEIQSNIILKNKIPQTVIDKEKLIIEQERNTFPVTTNMKAIDSAYSNLFNGKYEPLDPAGNKESLDKITRDDLVEYYNTLYSPDNMVTTIVGNVDENTINILNKHLGQMQKIIKPKPLLNRNLDDLIQSPVRFDIVGDKTKNAEVYMLFAGPKETNPKDIFTAICMDSLIEKDKEIVDSSNKFDTHINLYHQVIKDNKSGRHVINLGIGFEENNLNQGIKEFYSNIYNFMQKPIDPQKLEKEKEIIKESLASNKEDNLYLAGGLSSNMIIYGNVDSIAGETKIIDSITAKDVENFAKQTIDLNKVSMLVIHPQKTNNLNFKGSKPISENIEEYNLKNNLHVVIDFQPGTTRTIASFKLIPTKEIKAKPGVKTFLFMMSDNNDDNFKKKTNDLFSNTYILEGVINTNAEGHPQKTDNILWCIKNGINPDLTAENFEKQKKHIKRYLSSELENPNNIAEEKLGMFWLVESNPRKDILNNIDNIKLDDVKNYYNKLRVSSVGEVVLTMPYDLYQKDKQKILSTLSLGFPQMQKYQHIENKITKNVNIKESEIFIKPREDGEIVINKKYQIPTSNNIKDETAFALLDIIADKRISNSLREEQQLAYLAHSEVPKSISNKIINFHIQISSKNTENLKKSIDGFLKITQDLIENKISEEELNNAKIRLKIHNLNITTESSKRNEEISIGRGTPYGSNYLDETIKAIDEIQPEHIQRMAQMVFAKPSITVIETSRDSFDKNKTYLATQGDIIL